MENRMRSENAVSETREENRTTGIGAPFDMAGAKQIGDALSIYWNDFDADRFVVALFTGNGAEGRNRKKELPGTKPKSGGRIHYADAKRNIR